MTGGIMQLASTGIQNKYISGNPQITFFKIVYKRHTNFSMESIEQTFNGSADFGKKVTCTVSRNGDLMGPCYLEATLANDSNNCNRVGFQLIKQCELRIGGQMIDRHYSQWLDV